MTQLFQTKSILARLLAQENIIIEHKKVQTAHFDLKNRVMVLPIFKEMTGEMYDLLAGHEVGHALYTPLQGWHDAVIDDHSFKSYLNVIEDARIERKMKDKFPGLRRSFSIAYKRLVDDDFFGINGRDVNKMRFIDRINIFYKLGAHVRVTFSGEELEVLNEINAAETWEEIEAIARKIYNKAKEDAENAPEPEMPQDDIDWDEGDEDEDGDNESDDSEESFEYSIEDDEDSSEDSEDDGDGDDDSSDEEEETNNSGNKSVLDKSSKKTSSDDKEPQPSDITDKRASGGSESKDVSSETDNAFRENEKQLVDNTSGEVFICNIPTYNDKCIVPYKMVHAQISQSIKNTLAATESYESERNKNIVDNNTVVKYQEFVKRTNPVVNYMVKEFEMRKNATQLARAKIGKSGKINPKKLSRFKLDSDLFQRVTSVPHGKNHGLVLFIDLSGSMTDIIDSTFEQAIVLTQFCKKVNIPFEVYGFSDVHYHLDRFGIVPGEYCTLEANDLDVADRNFHLKQYLSSNMSGTAYREAITNMLYVGSCYKNYFRSDFLPYTENLGGTPLDETIIASIGIVDSFKKNNMLDNVNAIFLTDGEGGVTHTVRNSTNDRNIWMNSSSTIYIQHKETKERVKYEYLTKGNRDDGFVSARALIQIAKKVTGAKYTGYFIANRPTIIRKVFHYEFSSANYAAQVEQKKNLSKKLTESGFHSSDKFGFNEYFMVLNSNLKIQDNNIDVEVEAKKGVLARAFMKSMSTRGLQRMFLNRFMENIAA